MSEFELGFRRFLDENDVVYGVFSKTCDPFFVEAIGRAGFDFVILDNEHGPNAPRDLYPLIIAAALNDLYPIVRVGKLDALEIQRVMDLGVSGIQIPQIQSREDADMVRRFTRFHPRGERGVCRFVRAADFSIKAKENYFEEQNSITNIIHIEGMEGVRHFDEIIEVEDIDVVFIGPYDLSQSLGVTGQIEHPRVLKEIENLISRCRTTGKYIGIFTESIDGARRYKEMGVKYISFSVDIGIFAESCTRIIGELRSS
jgi:4-hydroxy-2-oxoheptanedioate aldolase